MKKLLGVVTVLALAHPAALAQDLSRVYTRPQPPPREALDRLHLKLAWRAYVPTESRRDGIFSVQFVDDQVFVQTQSGSVVALNANDGSVQWRGTAGGAYQVNFALAHNAKSVFAARASYLYAFERKTGRVQWSLDLGGAPSAAPVADDARIYAVLSNRRLVGYELPTPLNQGSRGAPAAAAPRAPDADRTSPFGVSGTARGSVGPLSSGRQSSQFDDNAVRPVLMWENHTAAAIEQQPLLTDEHLVLAGADGTFYITSKFRLQLPYRYESGAALSAPVGQHASREADGKLVEMAYVASRDFNVYALDVMKNKLAWKYTGGAPLHQKPAATDEDLYVGAERAGLSRLDRLSGRAHWQNRQAERFLAMNKKFVYATDSLGRLLVLDRSRGTVQGSYDTSAFVVPITNEWTDRLYLASNDGLLVCLHDYDYPKPLAVKTRPAPKKVEPKPGEAAGEKPAEDAKPEDKPKEKEKEKDEK